MKITILLAIKESYLFLKNSLGLMTHPFKTLRSLQRERDRSQQLLFLIWPGLVLGLGLILKWVVLVGLSLLMFGYLSYWMILVWKAR